LHGALQHFHFLGSVQMEHDLIDDCSRGLDSTVSVHLA
jgi:hypothetical protein